MEVSSTSMKAASATVAAMIQGLTLGFHCVSSAALGLAIVLTGAAAAGTGGSVCNSGKNFLLKALLFFISAMGNQELSVGALWPCEGSNLPLKYR